MNIHRSRPPREVVSWKTKRVRIKFTGNSRPPREVVSWKIQRLYVHTNYPLSISTRGRELKKMFRRSNRRQYMSISTRGRELKKYRLCNAHNGAGRPPREVVSWKNFNPDLVGVRVGRPPREVVSWKMITNGALREVGTSTSTRGRELKMYYKMRVLKRILQTFLSYIHLYLRYTYRSWKTIKQK